jgi:hypothetical protein
VRVRVAVVVGLVIASAVAVVAPAGAAPAWSVVPTAPGALYGHLASVSCPTPASCFAVGTLDSGGTKTRLVQRWNGTRWAAVVVPNPPGARTSQLAAVHCVSTVSCFAVGQYTTVAFKTLTLVMRWNGVTWTIVPSPNPLATPTSVLSGVYCTSTTSCFAVGGYFLSTPDSSAERTLIERWNGVTWTIVFSPNQANATDSELNGVTCSRPTDCFAVGSYTNEIVTNTLIVRWDGTQWRGSPSPNPASSTFNSLAGVSCPIPNYCIAVGSGHGTLVEQWNGTIWYLVASPNPPGATGASLTSVACPTVVGCFAVGDSFKQTKVNRLVMRTTPTSRALVIVPVPAGTVLSILSGVSCANPSSCFAVGDYRLGPSRRPLLLRYA